MKLVKKGDDKSVVWSEMKDGDIAIIREWGAGQHIGEIVQRYDKFLIKLGGRKSDSWGDIFSDHTTGLNSVCRVEILPPGTLLEI